MVHQLGAPFGNLQQDVEGHADVIEHEGEQLIEQPETECCSGGGHGCCGCRCRCKSCMCKTKLSMKDSNRNIYSGQGGKEIMDDIVADRVNEMGAQSHLCQPTSPSMSTAIIASKHKLPVAAALTHANLLHYEFHRRRDHPHHLDMLELWEKVDENPAPYFLSPVDDHPVMDNSMMIEGEGLDDSMLVDPGPSSADRSVLSSEYEAAWTQQTSSGGSGVLVGTGANFGTSFLRLSPECRHPKQGYYHSWH